VLAAQIGTTPLLVAMDATVSVASIPANLLAVPVAGWVMVWGLTAGAIAGLVGGPLAFGLHRPTAAMLSWIDGVAAVTSSPRLPGTGVVVSVLTVVSGWLLATAASVRWRRLGACGLVAALAVGLVPPDPVSSTRIAGLHIARARGGAVVLVAGGQVDGLRMLDELTRLRVARVDLAVFTSDSGATTDLAASLRASVPTGTVLAPSGRVRDALELFEGPVAVGPIDVAIRQQGDRWAAEIAGVG
jgi:competence protein ComEC